MRIGLKQENVTVGERMNALQMESVSLRVLCTRRRSQPMMEKECIHYGSCMDPFKERYINHKKSFINRRYSEETKLSKWVWELKDKNEQFEIAWSIEKQCVAYRPSAKKCDLCLSEKLCIIKGDPDNIINKRSEIANKCRHSNKYSYSRILLNKIS